MGFQKLCIFAGGGVPQTHVWLKVICTSWEGKQLLMSRDFTWAVKGNNREVFVCHDQTEMQRRLNDYAKTVLIKIQETFKDRCFVMRDSSCGMNVIKEVTGDSFQKNIQYFCDPFDSSQVANLLNVSEQQLEFELQCVYWGKA